MAELQNSRVLYVFVAAAILALLSLATTDVAFGKEVSADISASTAYDRLLAIDFYSNLDQEEGISVLNSIDLKDCEQTNVKVKDDLFVPIFVLTRDRVSSLKKSLDSYYETIKTPFEIVIIDHDSKFPAMLEYLDELMETEKNVTIRHLNGKLSWAQALTESNNIIQDYLKKHPDVENYVFTDPDIALLQTAPDVLLFYAGLLQACPGYKVVGPGLQISDIPSYYKTTLPEKQGFHGEGVYEKHSAYWKDVPNIAKWNGVGFHVVKKPIDTTFAMYPRDVPFHRLAGKSLRAYAPYAAVHVDWYDHSDNLPEDKVFYLKRQSGVNHW